MKLLALLCALCGALLMSHVPVLAENTNDAAFAAAREHLTRAGYAIPDDAFDAWCESSAQYLTLLETADLPAGFRDEMLARLNNPAEAAADLFGFSAYGDYDDENGVWTPWFHAAYAFDAEIFDVGRMYTLFLQGVESIAPDVTFTEIKENLSGIAVEMNFAAYRPTDGTRSVSFLCNGHPYEITLDSYGDWFNEEMIDRLNAVLAQEGCDGRLYTMNLDMQSILLVYGSENRARNLAAFFGYEPMW